MTKIVVPSNIRNAKDIPGINELVTEIHFEGDSIHIDEEDNPLQSLTSQCTIYTKSASLKLSLMEYVGDANIQVEPSGENMEIQTNLESALESTTTYLIDRNGVQYIWRADTNSVQIRRKPRLLQSQYSTPNNLILRSTYLPVDRVQGSVIHYDRSDVMDIYRRRVRQSLKASTRVEDRLQFQALLDSDTKLSQHKDFQDFESNLLSDMGMKHIVLEENTTSIQENAYLGQSYLQSIRIKGKLWNEENQTLQIGANAFKGLHPEFVLMVDDRTTYEKILEQRSNFMDDTATVEYYWVVTLSESRTVPYKIGYLYNYSEYLKGNVHIFYYEGKESNLFDKYMLSEEEDTHDITIPSYYQSDSIEGMCFDLDYENGYAIVYNLPLIEKVVHTHDTEEDIETGKIYNGDLSIRKTNVIVPPFNIRAEYMEFDTTDRRIYSTCTKMKKCLSEKYNFGDVLVFPHAVIFDQKEYPVRSIQCPIPETESYVPFQHSKKIVIPSTVNTIGDYVFYGGVLKEIQLSKRINSIGKYAFGNNSELKGVQLPESLRSIGEGCFFNTGIRTLTLPIQVSDFSKPIIQSPEEIHIETKVVNRLSTDWFNGFNENVIFYFYDENVYSYFRTSTAWLENWTENHRLLESEFLDQDQVFGAQVSMDGEEYVAKLISILDTRYKDTDIHLPSWIPYNGEVARVKSIGPNLFQGYENTIVQVTMGDTIESIDPNSFLNISNLATVSLSSRLKSLPDSIFQNTKITTLYIPFSVESIGSNVIPWNWMEYVIFEVQPCSSEDPTEERTYYESFLSRHQSFWKDLQAHNISVFFTDDRILPYYNNKANRVHLLKNSVHETLEAKNRCIITYDFLDEDHAILNYVQGYKRIYHIPEYVMNNDVPVRITGLNYVAFHDIQDPFDLYLYFQVKDVPQRFLYTHGLKRIHFQKPVLTMNVNAFQNCPELEEIHLYQNYYPTLNGSSSTMEITSKFRLHRDEAYVPEDDVPDGTRYEDALTGFQYIIHNGLFELQRWVPPESMLNILVVPSSIKYISEGNNEWDIPVSKIQDHAFQSCQIPIILDLRKVKDITIEEHAFEDSRGISVILPQSLYDRLYQEDRIQKSYIFFRYLDHVVYIQQVIHENALTGPKYPSMIEYLGVIYYLVHLSDQYSFAMISSFKTQMETGWLYHTFGEPFLKVNGITYEIRCIADSFFPDNAPKYKANMDFSMLSDSFYISEHVFYNANTSNLRIKFSDSQLQFYKNQGRILEKNGSLYLDGTVLILDEFLDPNEDTDGMALESSSEQPEEIQDVSSMEEVPTYQISDSGKEMEIQFPEEGS